MRVRKDEIPAQIDVPGAVARQTGDLFYWPSGHTVAVVDDAEVILFSPRAEHLAVMDHMKRQMANA
jgi:hypothetical protein